jgi:RNA polymerase sigma-70 factor (ECF subfamily)
MARQRSAERPDESLGVQGRTPDWTADDEDEELMAAFLRREPAAAGALYDRFASRIYGLGLVIFRNRTDAEDLVQDTLLRVLRSGSAFDPRRGSLDVWILMIARSLAIDLLRRRTLEARILSSQPRAAEASDEPGPEQQAVHRDLMERARAAMNRLPQRQRSAVVHAYLGQRSSSCVAELEGIPLGTAKSRIRQGIISLREAMPEGDAP